MTKSPSEEEYYITDYSGWRMLDGFERHFTERSIEDAQKVIRFYIDMGYGPEYHIYRTGQGDDELVCICTYDSETADVVVTGPDIVV